MRKTRYSMIMNPPNVRSSDQAVSGDLNAETIGEALQRAYNEVRSVAYLYPNYTGILSYELYCNGQRVCTLEFNAETLRKMPDPQEERYEYLLSKREELIDTLALVNNKANIGCPETIRESKHKQLIQDIARHAVELAYIEEELKRFKQDDSS